MRGRPSPLQIPPRSWAFVVAGSFGVAFLLFSATIGMLAFGGDCFASEAECEAVWEAQGADARVYFAILTIVIVVASLAVAIGGRRVPAVLLVVAIATQVLSQLSDAGNSLFGWVPRQLDLASPGLAILVLASGVQLVEQTIRRRMSRETT